MPDIQRTKVTDARTRILVVDEEASHLRALCDTLNEQGYVTAEFGDTKAALAALRGDRFDVLLTVLTTPDIDGIGLLHAALKIDPHLTGIVMTGEGTITSAVEAMRVGSVHHLPKPCGTRAVEPTLTRALADNQLRDDSLIEQSRRATAVEKETENLALESFGVTISHDLAAPLRTIAGFADLLSQQSRAELPPESQHYLDFIIKKTGHMQQQITDLLHFYQLGSQPLAVKRLSVSALAERALEDFIYDPAYTKTRVIVGDLPSCVGDAALLQQVYANLLSNSFKFSSKNAYPKIEIGCEKAVSGNIYFVRDNGTGFDVKQAGKLFNVFHRLHSQKEFPGTGVGLATVHQIILRHGGKLWASSNVGEGSTFFFTLGDGG